MSNPYLAVEKVTESLVGNTKVKLSFGLAANDKCREGVCVTYRPLVTYPPMSNRNLDLCYLSPCRGLFFYRW